MQYALVAATRGTTFRTGPSVVSGTSRLAPMRVIARASLIVALVLMAACSDTQPKSLPSTTARAAAVVTPASVGAEAAPCQSGVALQQVSTSFAKVIGTSPVFAAGMDATGVVPGSVVSGRLGGKILWVVESSMTAPVWVSVANLDATLAVVDQPAMQTVTLGRANAIPPQGDPKFREYPSTIAASGPGCVSVTVRWPPNGTWTANLRLTD